MSIKFTLLIMTILGILTGCAQNESIVIKMAEIERLRQECVKCEKELPGQCLVGDVGMCSDVFK